MIISYEIENFRSVYDPVFLDMLPSKKGGTKETDGNLFEVPEHKLKVLKSAVIFGANASGKSNILKSIEFFRHFILKSIDLKLNQKIPFDPFRLFRHAKNEPTKFTIEFLAKAKRYKYSFAINEVAVLNENLSLYNSRKPSEIFSRKIGEPIWFNANVKGEKKALESQLLDNQLLLTKAANSNFEQFIDIYEYFQNYVNVFTDDFSDNGYSLTRSYEEQAFKEKINDFLKHADTGIEAFEVEKEEIDPKFYKYLEVIPEEHRSLTLTKYAFNATVSHISCEKDGDLNEQPEFWPLEEESEGTQKIFAIAGPIIDILDKGSVLVFDEINNSLHPLISQFLVKLFNDPVRNPNGAQLIFTTHDVTLLDNELFRRDQIWLTEKNKCGFTEFNSLCACEVRKDVPLQKWYLTGRFGATPFIPDLIVD